MPGPAYILRSYAGATKALQLLGECNATDLTFTADPTVGSFANWPDGSGGDFCLAIDQGLPILEKIMCSSFNRNTGVFTVASGTGWTGGDNGRGYDGTAAVDHVVQPNISQIILVWSAVEAQEANITAATVMGGAAAASNGEVFTVVNGVPTWQTPGGSSAGLMPIGGILLWAAAGNFPSGFLACNGQQVSQTSYPTLYGILGTSYGSGTGTFGLPNFNGKFPIGSGAGSPATNPGGSGGNTTINSTQLPAHTHTVNDGGHTHPTHLDGDTGFVGIVTDNTSSTIAIPTGAAGFQPSWLQVTENAGFNWQNSGAGISVTGGGSGSAFYPPYLGMLYLMRCM